MAKGTVNKVIILGRLGQDPEMRSTTGGTQIANLSLATTEMGAKDQAGNRQESTEWHSVILFGRLAEIAAQYLNKGSQVYVEGRLQTRKWQDRKGQDRYSTEIVANEMQFIGGRGDNAGGGQQGGYGQPQIGGLVGRIGGGFNNPPAGGFNNPQGGGVNQQNGGFNNQPSGGFGQQQTPSSQEMVSGSPIDFDDSIPF